MDTWLFVTLIVIALFIFLAFIIWLDWIFKCRKSSMENKLNSYLTGFLVFGLEDAKDEIFIFDGILGVNDTQLILLIVFKKRLSTQRLLLE